MGRCGPSQSVPLFLGTSQRHFPEKIRQQSRKSGGRCLLRRVLCGNNEGFHHIFGKLLQTGQGRRGNLHGLYPRINKTPLGVFFYFGERLDICRERLKCRSAKVQSMKNLNGTTRGRSLQDKALSLHCLNKNRQTIKLSSVGNGFYAVPPIVPPSSPILHPLPVDKTPIWYIIILNE